MRHGGAAPMAYRISLIVSWRIAYRLSRIADRRSSLALATMRDMRYAISDTREAEPH